MCSRHSNTSEATEMPRLQYKWGNGTIYIHMYKCIFTAICKQELHPGYREKCIRDIYIYIYIYTKCTPFPLMAELSTNPLGVFVVLWNYDFQTVLHTAEFSTNSLGDFVVFWNCDFHTVFDTEELSSNSLGGYCGVLEL